MDNVWSWELVLQESRLKPHLQPDGHVLKEVRSNVNKRNPEPHNGLHHLCLTSNWWSEGVAAALGLVGGGPIGARLAHSFQSWTRDKAIEVAAVGKFWRVGGRGTNEPKWPTQTCKALLCQPRRPDQLSQSEKWLVGTSRTIQPQLHSCFEKQTRNATQVKSRICALKHTMLTLPCFNVYFSCYSSCLVHVVWSYPEFGVYVSAWLQG